MHLARFPRVHLAHLPTPLEPMTRLSSLLGGPRLWIKRDDCTGLATGGNKTRKLEYLVADALDQGCDTLVTVGAVQSNHCRQTAAAAAKVGLDCEILLERRVDDHSDAYENSANVFLDRLMGAAVTYFPGGHDMKAELVAHGERLEADGMKPYLIPGGGSNAIGALGYVNCAVETLRQADELGLVIDHVVMATGSTGTQAGLVVGFTGSGSGVPVLGVSTRHPKAKQESNVQRLVDATTDYMGLPPIHSEHVVANDDYVGGGYGIPTDSMVEAVRMAAQYEAILLDPVYTGKGMAGLIGLVREGYFEGAENIVFLHTGGSVGLFAQESLFVDR
jgi:L-cysteate sulfo-lyase